MSLSSGCCLYLFANWSNGRTLSPHPPFQAWIQICRLSKDTNVFFSTNLVTCPSFSWLRKFLLRSDKKLLHNRLTTCFSLPPKYVCSLQCPCVLNRFYSQYFIKNRVVLSSKKLSHSYHIINLVQHSGLVTAKVSSSNNQPYEYFSV